MPSGPLAFLTFIDFRIPCTRSCVITGRDMGHLRGEEVGGGMSESSRVELDEKKEAEEISLFSRSISYRTIRANKRRKGRFTEVVRDIFDKRPEIFISRRTMEKESFSIHDKHCLSPEGQESNCHRTKDFEEKKNLPIPSRITAPTFSAETE